MRILLKMNLIRGVAFIDLEKAFNTIDHQIILLKLKNYGINENSLTWSIPISLIEFKSAGLTINCRILCQQLVVFPQGSSLGPLLFLIYINDLPRMFADDTSVSYASNFQALFQSRIFKARGHLV